MTVLKRLKDALDASSEPAATPYSVAYSAITGHKGLFTKAIDAVTKKGVSLIVNAVHPHHDFPAYTDPPTPADVTAALKEANVPETQLPMIEARFADFKETAMAKRMQLDTLVWQEISAMKLSQYIQLSQRATYFSDFVKLLTPAAHKNSKTAVKAAKPMGEAGAGFEAVADVVKAAVEGVAPAAEAAADVGRAVLPDAGAVVRGVTRSTLPAEAEEAGEQGLKNVLQENFSPLRSANRIPDPSGLPGTSADVFAETPTPSNMERFLEFKNKAWQEARNLPQAVKDKISRMTYKDFLAMAGSSLASSAMTGVAARVATADYIKHHGIVGSVARGVHKVTDAVLPHLEKASDVLTYVDLIGEHGPEVLASMTAAQKRKFEKIYEDLAESMESATKQRRAAAIEAISKKLPADAMPSSLKPSFLDKDEEDVRKQIRLLNQRVGISDPAAMQRRDTAPGNPNEPPVTHPIAAPTGLVKCEPHEKPQPASFRGQQSAVNCAAP